MASTNTPKSRRKLKLIWARPAAGDRREIRAYIARDNPSAALAIDELFSRNSRHLIDHPLLGRPGRVVGTRELVVHPKYILIYDLTQDAVRVLRVLHVALEWPPRSS